MSTVLSGSRQVDGRVGSIGRGWTTYSESPDADSDMLLLSLWRAIRRRWKLVGICFLTIALLGCLGFWMWPTRYESKAQLAFSFDDSDTVQLDDSALGSLGSDDQQTKLATQVAILQNQDLILDVVSRLDLARNHNFYKYAAPSLDSSKLSPFDQERIVKEFKRRLSVRIVPKTYLVEVSFRNPSPQLSQRILSELLSQYVQRSFEARFLDTQQSADWLQKQIDGLRTDVEKNELKLVQLQRQNGLLLVGIGQTGQVGTTASAQLEEVIKAEVAGEADRIQKEAAYRASLTGNPELLASIMPESKIVILRQEQATLSAQLSSQTSQFGPQYPAVVQTRAALAEVNQSIQKEVAVLQEQLREQFLAAQRGETLLQGTEDAAKAEAYKQLGAAAELVALQEEVDSGRRLYEDLERKLKESSVLAGLKSTQVDIVAKPDIPYKPAEPNPLIFSAVLLFLGSISSITAAKLRENADHAIGNAYEIENLAHIPVLASLPHQELTGTALKLRADSNAPSVYSIIQGSPKSQLAEAIRSLRSALLLSSTVRPKVFLIASPLPSEGKSSTALGLATILAQKEVRVLLIEADMRRPVFHRWFSVRGTTFGLSTLLSGNSSYEESIYSPPDSPRLTILPAGLVAPYPAELLDSAAMTTLLNRARSEFDFIVIDTPPLLSVADALPLAVASDAVLLVTRSRNTRRRALLDSCNMLVRSGVNLVGAVLNDVNDFDGARYYYGQYKNYYNDDAVEDSTKQM